MWRAVDKISGTNRCLFNAVRQLSPNRHSHESRSLSGLTRLHPDMYQDQGRSYAALERWIPAYAGMTDRMMFLFPPQYWRFRLCSRRRIRVRGCGNYRSSTTRLSSTVARCSSIAGGISSRSPWQKGGIAQGKDLLQVVRHTGAEPSHVGRAGFPRNRSLL